MLSVREKQQQKGNKGTHLAIFVPIKTPQPSKTQELMYTHQTICHPAPLPLRWGVVPKLPRLALQACILLPKLLRSPDDRGAPPHLAKLKFSIQSPERVMALMSQDKHGACSPQTLKRRVAISLGVKDSGVAGAFVIINN